MSMLQELLVGPHYTYEDSVFVDPNTVGFFDGRLCLWVALDVILEVGRHEMDELRNMARKRVWSLDGEFGLQSHETI